MIRLPARFQAVLDKADKKLQADGARIIQNYQVLLERNDVYFFRDYTDHGIEHINGVLRSSDNLICPETFNLLDAKDILVGIFSVLLHDIGLHLSPEGFKSLLNGVWDSKRIVAFDKKTWAEEWQDFLKDAKRYTEQQKINIWGDSNAIVKEPNLNNLDEADRKLIGEFIRRHHPRLAHEIAINGYPYSEGGDNELNAGIDKNICELSGLVARSHGMNIRASYEPLKSKYAASWKKPFGVKIIFWMAVLRIADYIQIESERAPKILLNIKSFSSPFSKAEWELHNCIDFVDPETDDPELLNVHASPKDPIQFQKLDGLLKDIQKELDTTWAVLGEVYGALFKMKYRRLASNIQDTDTFAKGVDYIPFPLRFKTDPSLLGLLIAPLYNNEPGVGVRELLQNALDACLERVYLEKGDSSYMQKIQISLKGAVDGIYFRIEDNGVGMDLATLTNYYFNSGKSYRNSSEWAKLYSGSKGSEVLRTGRFGIGALSSFLLGNEVKISTRAMNAPYGLSFTMRPFEDSVIINKDYTLEVGTSISIKIKPEVQTKIFAALDNAPVERLSWFKSYVLKNDHIHTNIAEELKPAFDFLEESKIIPAIREGAGWKSFRANGVDVYFNYGIIDDAAPYRVNGRLVHNGFEIKGGYDMPLSKYSWYLPNVYVEDKDSAIMLSLDRNSIYNDRLPFQGMLINQIACGIIEDIEAMEFDDYGEFKVPKERKLSFAPAFSISDHIVCFKDHYSFNLPFILKGLGCDKIYNMMMDEAGPEPAFDDVFLEDSAYRLSRNGNSLRSWFSLGRFNKKYKSLYSQQLVFIDPVYKAEQKMMSGSSEVIDAEARLKLLSKQIEDEKVAIEDDFLNKEVLLKKSPALKITRDSFIWDGDLSIPGLIDAFEGYYNGDYKIPYDRSKRRIASRVLS
ncbi:ATP-binding protein [Pedobacter aquatilis]|uniref:HD domain-containing protein n=1 Tax=Pedobacter aquatilis TaxID=351343 RepID=UPI00292D3F73|nr:ATP-binding protein [Pedobacter aquatilis]